MGGRDKKNFSSASGKVGEKSMIRMPAAFRTMLKQRGYSDKAIKEIWKWYDPSE